MTATPNAEITQFLTKRLAQLSTGSPGARADLARLRRGIGKKPGEIPELWALTLDGPNEKYQGAEATRMENAIYTALTLFALHQQSRPTSVHKPSKEDARYTMGWAARKLVDSGSSEKAVQRHLNALTTAPTMSELAHHSKSLISQYRSANIALDYVQLAIDFYWLQNPRTAQRVLLSWGRDFVANKNNPSEQTTEGA